MKFSRHVLPLLLLALLALALVGPPALDTMPGHEQSDLYDHVWGWYWFRREILHGRLPLWTAITHGSGGALWFVDPLGALWSLPFQAILPLPAAVGAVIWLRAAAGLWAFYALGISYWRDRGAALATAAVGGAGAYTLSLLHSGVLEYLEVAPLPLFWLACRRRTDPRAAGWAAACWVWACLGSFYYGAFTGLLWLGACRVAGIGFGARVLARAILPLALITGTAAWTLSHPDAVIAADSAPGWNYKNLPVTDLLTFVHPSWHFPDNARAGNLGILHANSYGVLPLLLAGAVWLRRRHDPEVRRLGRAFVALAVLALGPVLCVAGNVITAGGWAIPLPAALLYLPGSPLRFLHHPYRLVILPLIPLSLLAGRALAGQGIAGTTPVMRALPLLIIGGIVAERLLASPAPWPVARASAEIPPIYATLPVTNAVDAQAGVLDFPPENHLQNRRYAWYQTAHGRPVPYGVNVYVPEELRLNPAWLSWMACLQDRGARAIPREGGAPVWNGRPLKGLQVTPATVAAGRRQLAERYGWLVAHTGAMSAAEVGCLRERMGAPTAEAGDALAWALR